MRSSKHGLPHERVLRALDAGAACFGQKGFHEASFEDVARESGLSRGSLYWYFDSKEQLYDAVLDHCAARLDASLGADLDVGGEGPLVARFLERVAADVESQENVYRLIYWGSRPSSAGERLGALTMRLLSAVRRIVEEARRRGEVDAALGEATVDMVHALAEGLVIRRLLDRDFDVARYIAAVAEVLAPKTEREPVDER
jgi:AcrR family transcriptional regulator